jgi:hypothetical protein
MVAAAAVGIEERSVHEGAILLSDSESSLSLPAGIAPMLQKQRTTVRDSVLLLCLGKAGCNKKIVRKSVQIALRCEKPFFRAAPFLEDGHYPSFAPPGQRPGYIELRDTATLSGFDKGRLNIHPVLELVLRILEGGDILCGDAGRSRSLAALGSGSHHARHGHHRALRSIDLRENRITRRTHLADCPPHETEAGVELVQVTEGLEHGIRFGPPLAAEEVRTTVIPTARGDLRSLMLTRPIRADIVTTQSDTPAWL